MFFFNVHTYNITTSNPKASTEQQLIKVKITTTNKNSAIFWGTHDMNEKYAFDYMRKH